MKLRNFLMMALLFAGVTFVVTGCSDDSQSSSTSSSTSSSSSESSAEDQVKAAAEKFVSSKKGEMEEDGISNLEFAKIKLVNDNYALACYSASIEGKSEKPFALHCQKKDGKWEVVDFEDNWEPKDKYK